MTKLIELIRSLAPGESIAFTCMEHSDIFVSFAIRIGNNPSRTGAATSVSRGIVNGEVGEEILLTAGADLAEKVRARNLKG